MQNKDKVKLQHKLVNDLYEKARTDSPRRIYTSAWYPQLLKEYNKLDKIIKNAIPCHSDLNAPKRRLVKVKVKLKAAQ